MQTKLPDSIKTVEDAKKFLRELHENNEDYHCEDDACSIVNGKTNQLLFTREEGAQLNSLMGDIYNLPGNDGKHDNSIKFCPCGYLLFLQKEIKFENIMKVCDVYTNQLLPETVHYITGFEPAWVDSDKLMSEDIFNIETIVDDVKEQGDDIHNPITGIGEDIVEQIDILKLSISEQDSQYFRLIPTKN